ncbi:MAG: prepilin-type N-terminal cleavage/methylation domain-containing protein [Candidatus Omnitrophota bacterium]
MCKSRRLKKGFTLIELIIVIVIIGIIATFAVPQYFGFIGRAQGAKAKNAITLIVQAEKIIRAETSSYMPVASGASINGTIGTNASGMDLTEIDNDANFVYDVTAAGVVTATMSNEAAGNCPETATITFTMATNAWTEHDCF